MKLCSKYVWVVITSKSLYDFRIKNLILHKVYLINNKVGSNYKENRRDHDIALLELEEDLDLNIYTPACLASPGASFNGQRAIVAGWGLTNLSDPSNPSNVPLQFSDLTVVDDESCPGEINVNGDFFERSESDICGLSSKHFAGGTCRVNIIH